MQATVGSHRTPAGPPAFVRLLANPVRWRLLRELVRSDRAVSELTRAARRAAELGVVPPGSAARGRARAHASQLGRWTRQLLRRRSRGAAGTSCKPRAVRCIPVCGSCRRSRHDAAADGCPAPKAAGPVPVHREQRAVADRGGAARARCRRARSTPRRPGATRSRCIRNAVRVMKKRGIDISGNRTKHLDEFVGAALRRRDHAVRPRPRGLPGVPVAPGPRRTGASPIPRSKAPNDRATFPAFERTADRARDAHRVPAPSAGRTIDEEVNACRTMRRSMSATWSTTSTSRSRSTPSMLGFEVLTSASPAFADVKRGNLRLLLAGPDELRGPTDARRPQARTGRLEPHPLHRRRHRRRSRAAPRRRRHVPQRHRDGPGGKQILLEDPSGNVVELFQPAGSLTEPSEQP